MVRVVPVAASVRTSAPAPWSWRTVKPSPRSTSPGVTAFDVPATVSYTPAESVPQAQYTQRPAAWSSLGTQARPGTVTVESVFASGMLYEVSLPAVVVALQRVEPFRAAARTDRFSFWPWPNSPTYCCGVAPPESNTA
ncbi:hypothetical protein P9869_01995 [Streptomyces ossamyceticus]|nr:hypothetical protein [Streptomyces ossamyceticus]